MKKNHEMDGKKCLNQFDLFVIFFIKITINNLILLVLNYDIRFHIMPQF